MSLLLKRVIQALALAAVFAVMFGATWLMPTRGAGSTIAAIGFLLLSGVLASELCDVIGLPHLTGYLLAGIAAGPYVLHLVDYATVADLSPVNTLALALIALAGGAELRVSDLKRNLGPLFWALCIQSTFVLIATALVFLALSRFIPFTAALGTSSVLGVALLWGVLQVARSPAACMGILTQTRAVGPVARFSLAFVMSSDVVVILLLAFAIMVTRPLLDPTAELSVDDLGLVGHQIVGSIALGTSFGLVLAAYLRLVGKQLLVVLVAVGFGMTALLRYLHFEPLLTFLISGFVVQNASSQGPKLIHATEETGSIVYVVFFATAGADLNLPLLAQLWPMALTLAVLRALVTWSAHAVSCRLADTTPEVRRWGWSGLISQAGLALGLSVVIADSLPGLGDGFRALAIATIAINEMVGPVLFKLGIDRAGESRPDVARRSIATPLAS
jgi:Kef-type K+ transport system membrane component KefB